MRVWGFHAHALCERLIASSIVESLSDSDVNGGNGAMSASGCSDCLSLGQRRVDDVVSVIFVQGSSPHARGRLLAQVAGMNWERITPRMRGEDWVYRISGSCPTGSPPHARGRRDWGAPVREQERITPACAGKTLARTHPGRRTAGSPPHARGRRDVHELRIRLVRITPACAGKTKTSVCTGIRKGDHPRMRGEDGFVSEMLTYSSPSPPHARGRWVGVGLSMCVGRITPACAGKTH